MTGCGIAHGYGPAMREPGVRPEAGGRVAMVTGRYPAFSMTFVDREVRALKSLGYDVVTVTVRAPQRGALAGPFQEEEARKVHGLRASAWNPITVLRACMSALRTPRQLIACLRLTAAARPDGGLVLQARHAIYLCEAVLLADFLRRRQVRHVHNHLGDSSGTVAMLAAELAGIPFSMTLHGPEVFEAPERWRLDVKIARAKAVICISDDCRDKARHHCSASQREKLHVVRCGVELARYGQTTLARSGRRLLFIGRLVHRKGAPILLEAFSRLRAERCDLVLDVAGEGPQRRDLERLVEERGLADVVRFLVLLDEAGVAKALQAADLLVVPSLSEGLPVVIMEAMASGVPVVASRVDGIPELVRDGETGLLVPPSDPDALADAIARLMADSVSRDRMGAEGRRIVTELHDAARNARALAGIILGDGDPVPGGSDGRRNLDPSSGSARSVDGAGQPSDTR